MRPAILLPAADTQEFVRKSGVPERKFRSKFVSPKYDIAVPLAFVHATVEYILAGDASVFADTPFQ